MENKKVLTELKGGVLIVKINRNEKRNSIDPETSAMMEAIFNDAEKDPNVGCIIVTGAGERSFCSGEDLSAYDENGTCQTIMEHGFAELQSVSVQNLSSALVTVPQLQVVWRSRLPAILS